MKSRRIGTDSETVFVLAFEPGEEVSQGLMDFAKKNQLFAAKFTGLGALSEATLGYFDIDKKEYHRIPISHQVEVLSLVGTIAEHDGEPKVHAHIVVGERDGTARGGHLLNGIVRPILEVTIVETSAHLKRKFDPSTGLPLLDPEAVTLPPRRGRED